MAIRYDKDRGIYKDYSILIDTKKDLLEVAGNLCHKEEHERVVREVELAHQLGCKEFYFLIASNKAQTIEQLKQWKSPRTKIKGETLLKTMATFSKHHNCKFLIVPKISIGKQIIELLTK